MTRRRKKDGGASLDSLLDTMTNVVGILVIMLAVTQLNVGDAVNRFLRAQTGIEEAAQVTADQLTEITARQAAVAQSIVLLKQQQVDLEADRNAVELKMQEQEKRVAALAARIDEINEANADPAKAAKLTEQKKLAVQKSDEQLAALEKSMSVLQVAVDDTPRRSRPAPKVVKLPNPRSAPEGIQPITFVCKEGRIAQVPLDGLQRLAQAKLRTVLAKKNEKGEVDCQRMVEQFAKSRVGNEQFRLSIYVSNYRPYLTVDKVAGAGESTEVLLHKNSRYQQQIRRTDSKKYFARFLVWPDSLETYLEARRICDEQGVLAGWVPFYATQQWRTPLGVTVTCEGKPPPPPRPAKPVTPVKPTTPAPPKRALPADTVD